MIKSVFRKLPVISLIILFIYASIGYIQAGWLASFPNQPLELKEMRLMWADRWLGVSIASLFSLIILFAWKMVKKQNSKITHEVTEEKQ